MQSVAVKKNILYQENPPLGFDAYLPMESRKKKPLVLLIHGGGFENGDKEQPFYIKMSEAIAKTGYPAVCLNYTLSNPCACPAARALELAVNDVLKAIRFIQCDPELQKLGENGMALLGDSAAGSIAVNLSLDYGKEIGIVGCVDMWGGMRSETAATPWGGNVYLKEIKPARAPVFLLLHGTADSIAGYDVSVRLKEQLNRNAVPNSLIPLEGAEHYPEERFEEILQLVLHFLQQL